RLRRIDIEAGAGAEIVALVLPGDLQAARARVGDDDREAELGGDALRARLDDEVLLRAGEAGEPVEHRHRARVRLRRQEYAEAHHAGGLARFVAIDALHAAEALAARDGGQQQNLSTPPPSGSSAPRASGRSPR